MGIFDEPPQSEAEYEAEQNERRDNWAFVIFCFGAGFVFAYSYLADGRGFGVRVAQAAGNAVGLAILPAVAGAVAARFTRKWGYVFLFAYALACGLAYLGKLVR